LANEKENKVYYQQRSRPPNNNIINAMISSPFAALQLSPSRKQIQFRSGLKILFYLMNGQSEDGMDCKDWPALIHLYGPKDSPKPYRYISSNMFQARGPFIVDP
jgi:hypothetical protein